MVIDKTIDLCSANTTSNIVKSVLNSTKFDDAKDVVAKFIIQSRTQVNEHQVMAYQSKTRYNNRRGNFRGNNRIRNNWLGNYSGNYSQKNNNNRRNNYQNGNRVGNYRGRYNNSNNYNGRNTSDNWRNNGQGGNNNRNHRVYYVENSEVPPPGAQNDQNVQLSQADTRNQMRN